jgi:predicted dehydrogenase
MDRRTFLSTSGAFVVSASAVKGTAANSSLAVGVIGPGRRGTALMRALARTGQPARIAALCDIYDDQLELARKNVPETATVKACRDYRELLADKSIDAVIIATPPYNHPEIFEAAAGAGKAVYMEKPVAVSVKGCRRVLEAAQRARANAVIGFQTRFGPALQEARKRVKEGAIGEIIMVQGQYYSRKLPYREGSWSPAEDRVRNWLMYREMSGDILVEQNCHSLDRVNYFLEAHPVTAVGRGGLKHNAPHYKTIMDHTSVTFEFTNGVRHNYSSNQFTQYGGAVMETYIGTRGTLVSQAGKAVIHDGSPAPWVFESQEDATVLALRQWAGDILAAQPSNNVEQGVEATMTSLLGLMSMLRERPAVWDKL